MADEQTGTALGQVLAEAAERGLRAKGGRPAPLVRTPRGVPADHPRAVWLRWKGVEALAHLGRASWSDLDGRAAAAAHAVRAGTPLLTWLETHVGPSALPRPRG